MADNHDEIAPFVLDDWRSDALLGLRPEEADRRILALIKEVQRLGHRIEELEVELDAHGLKRERDEARNAAKEILLDSVSWDEHAFRKLAEGVWKAFPWLLEKRTPRE